MTSPTPAIFSMFSGIGGLDLAVEAVTGGRVVAFSEYNPDTKAGDPWSSAKVLAARWPGVPNLGDVTQIDWSDVGEVDIICAGFPCQDLSYAGRGAGITKGTRSGLWSYIADAARVLRPRAILLENVAAIVNRRPGLDVVLAGLAAIGYDCRWTCVRASDVGAPHRRDRWFAVAYPAGEQMGSTRFAWAGAAGAAADPRRGGIQRRSDDRGVAGTQGAGAGEGLQRQRWGDAARDGCAAAADGASSRWGPAARVARRRDSGDADGRWQAEPRRRGSAVADADSEGRARLKASDGTYRRVGEQHRDDADRRCVVVEWGEWKPAIDRWVRVLGRPAPTPTVLAPGYIAMRQRRLERRDPRPVGRRGSLRPQRVLSPEFVEWMMGLDDGWTDVGISRPQRLYGLGNTALPLQAVEAYRRLGC